MIDVLSHSTEIGPSESTGPKEFLVLDPHFRRAQNRDGLGVELSCKALSLSKGAIFLT